LSLDIGEQVLTFHTKAWSSFAPPTCRMPLGPSQHRLDDLEFETNVLHDAYIAAP
jgi:hypothetical protein